MRLYLAGPMAGLKDWNFPAFMEAAGRLREMGFEVVNPAEMDMEIDGFVPTPDTVQPFIHYMRRDLPAVMSCEGIALLPGWQNSKGATLEVRVATDCGLLFYDAMTGEPLVETVLQEAYRLVHGERGAAYAHPLVDYTCTAAIWNAIWGPHGANKLKADLVAEDAILGMVGVKMSRESRQHKRDNLTDLAGYAECLNMTIEERRGRMSEGGP